MFTSTNPATGETIATWPELTDSELEAKLAASADAYARWRTSRFDERTALLGRIGDAFEANRDRLAEMTTREMGKTIASARAEADKCASLFRYLAKAGPAMLEDERYPAEGLEATGRWLPIGPVLAVMPWNFPLWQVVRFVAPAIMAGNVGLLKHASNVQGCAALLQEMVEEGGGEGLFLNLALPSSRVAGVIADDRVRAVTLTGSEGAGRAVAKAAGEHVKKVVLELGGSDPFVVMPSADLDQAATTAVKARIQNTGQSCICAKRMIVHADVYDDFMKRFEAGMRDVIAGDPMDEATDMGPMSSAEQRDTVVGQVEAAVKEGATLRFGGEAMEGPGAYMSAGVLTDVPPDSETATEELFGPVAMVFRAADLDDAIRLANATPFGLGSSVWTNEADERERLVRDLDCGMTAVNRMLASQPEAPFGGTKASGVGRELSRHGMHEFMNLKTVLG